MVSDRVGDFIIRLKNAGAIGKTSVAVPYSKHVEEIAKKLQALGFVKSVEASKNPYEFEVTLAYDERGRSKIRGVKRISKPGRRLYTPSTKAHNVKNGAGSRIL
ncbi:MAG TPA: 30S ribosomal protein S8, partial [Candidatus Paceibacterota bacterium]|nr:30S ribosomal protein S8 [Candidatus Paceibacterota bacterium]